MGVQLSGGALWSRRTSPSPETSRTSEPSRTVANSQPFRSIPNRAEPSRRTVPVPNRPEPPRDGSGNVQRFWTVRDGSGWGRFGTHSPVRNGSGASAQPAQPAQSSGRCWAVEAPVEENPKQSRACSLALAVLRKLARTEKCGSLQHCPSTVDNTSVGTS